MSASAGPNVNESGLVLCLDADNTKSYSGSGTTWSDLSTGANNGTLVNTPTTDGASFTFSYLSSQQVTFADNSNLQFLGTLNYTLEAWIYPTRNPGASNWTGIFNRESNPGTGRDGYNLFFLGSATTNTYFTSERFYSGTTTSASIALDSTVSVNNWHQIVVTYDGASLKMYRNGEYVTFSTSTGSLTNTAATLTIANRAGNYFDGKIAVTNIYSRALSATEVRQNFNAYRTRFAI